MKALWDQVWYKTTFLLLLAVNSAQLYYRGFLSDQEESEDTFKWLELFLWVLHLFKNTAQMWKIFSVYQDNYILMQVSADAL